MSRKHFSGLAIAVALVLLAVFILLPSRTGRQQGAVDVAFWPELAGEVNEVDQLAVTVAGNERIATLVRGEGGWTVSELHGYPADWTKLRAVLAALAQAKVVEAKTANPEFHARLGVEDVAAADAAGVLLSLTVAGQEQGVVVGEAAGQRKGRYLRRAESPQAVLVEFDAEVPRTALGWADAAIADLPAATVAEVEIIHPDRDRILVRKVSADDTDYVLENLPAGRELQSSWSANALGGLLAGLRMEAVRPAAELDWTNPLLARVLTFDGLEVRVESVEAGEEHWLRLSATAPFGAAPPVVEAAPAGVDAAEPAGEAGAADDAGAADAATAGDAPGAQTAPVEAAPTAAERAEALNARLSGWAFRVPGYKFEAIDKRLEDLLKPPADGKGET